MKGKKENKIVPIKEIVLETNLVIRESSNQLKNH